MTNDESSETESAGCAFAAASVAAYFATVASAMASPTPLRNQQSGVCVRRQAAEKPWTDEAGESDT